MKSNNLYTDSYEKEKSKIIKILFAGETKVFFSVYEKETFLYESILHISEFQKRYELINSHQTAILYNTKKYLK